MLKRVNEQTRISIVTPLIIAACMFLLTGCGGENEELLESNPIISTTLHKNKVPVVPISTIAPTAVSVSMMEKNTSSATLAGITEIPQPPPTTTTITPAITPDKITEFTPNLNIIENGAPKKNEPEESILPIKQTAVIIQPEPKQMPMMEMLNNEPIAPIIKAITPINTTEPSNKIEAVITPKSSIEPPPNLNISSEEAEQLELLNVFRKENNIHTLTFNAQLMQSAQKYAEDMLKTKKFSHKGADGSTYIMRITAAGYTNYRSLGENIAVGQTSVPQVINDWKKSPTHRENMLRGSFTQVGFGHAGNYWVQHFGSPK
jgi:uncharacterized protein YkwD